MNEYVFNENIKFINTWKSNNPNLQYITLENNILKNSKGISIDLKNYLISSILKNEFINNNINSINEDLFFKIVELNSKAFEISNRHLENITNDERIRKIKINEKGEAIAETEKDNNVEITGHKALKVLSTYTNLIANNTVHISLSTLLKKLNNNKFYDLIETNFELSSSDYDYVTNFSNFMLELAINKEYITEETKSLLNNYEFLMFNLKNSDNITRNQKLALNQYESNQLLLNSTNKQKDSSKNDDNQNNNNNNDSNTPPNNKENNSNNNDDINTNENQNNINQTNETEKIIAVEDKKEESLENKESSSYGFSSYVLIGISIFITLMFTILLIIIQ